MASEYRIQVVHKDTGKIVEWIPGLDVEKDFETELVDRVVAKGVGIARTSSHVADDARTAFRELLYDLKSRV